MKAITDLITDSAAYAPLTHTTMLATVPEFEDDRLGSLTKQLIALGAKHLERVVELREQVRIMDAEILRAIPGLSQVSRRLETMEN